MKKIIYLSLGIFLSFNFSADAQIFKKLKNKVEEKVERTTTENISNKAANETDKSLNNMWEKKAAKQTTPSSTTGMASVENIPNTYQFDWVYNMNMKSEQQSNQIIYHIKKGAPYVGMRVPGSEEMITVMDTKNNLSVMFINSGGTKYVAATKMENTAGESQNSYEDMNIEKIGSKNIIGYHCQGYKSENKDYEFTFYVTDEAEISFTDMFQENQTDLPNGFNPDWLQNGTGLLMEMQMKHKSNPDKNISMTCTGIEKKNFTIRTSDYENMTRK